MILFVLLKRSNDHLIKFPLQFYVFNHMSFYLLYPSFSTEIYLLKEDLYILTTKGCSTFSLYVIFVKGNLAHFFNNFPRFSFNKLSLRNSIICNL